jgi:alanyl-tRNA synthetase
MGFERMAKVLQEKETVYETDLFWPIIQLIEKHLGIKYIGNERRMRIIADHLRTSFFLIHDGITPSNEGRGYVLRRLIRRMFYNLILLKEVSEKESADLIEDIMNRVADNFEGTSFEVKNICKVLLKETTQFQKTITNGQKLLKELFEKNKDKRLITSADAFKLYDSCGFPFELTLELANEHGFKVDQK